MGTLERLLACLALATVLCGCNGLVGGDTTPHEAGEADSALPEEPREDTLHIRGHWVVVEMQFDGETTPMSHGESHYVFTDKEVKVCSAQVGLSFDYDMNGATEPKQLDFHVGPQGSRFPGIYKFEDGRLRICRVLAEGAPRPDGFVTHHGDNRQMDVLERVPRSRIALTALVKQGFQPADDRLTAETRQWLTDSVRLLESKEYLKFVKECTLPEDRRKLTASGRSLEQVVAAFYPKIAPPLIQTLRACERKVPLANLAETEVIFDMRDTHFNGAWPDRELCLQKTEDGKWYLRNKEKE